MSRRLSLLFTGLLVVTAGLLLSLGACSGGASTPPNQPPTAASKIKQVVVIFPGEPRAG